MIKRVEQTRMQDKKYTILMLGIMTVQMITISLLVLNINNMIVKMDEYSSMWNMVYLKITEEVQPEIIQNITYVPQPARSIEITPEGVFVKIQTHMMTEDGFLKIPPSFKKIAIEVGANDRNTLDQEYLPKHTDTFLLAFEPIVDKYARLMSRFERGADRFQPLGYHNNRGMVFPMAVVKPEDEGTMMSFTMSGVDGCSSLMDLDSGAQKWAPWCFDVKEKRKVPTISLQTVIRLIPSDVEISHLKIDAQGYDLNVLESAGHQMHRIKNVCMEVIGDNHAALYKSQLKCTDVAKQMKLFGFIENNWNSTTSCSWTNFPEHDMCWFRR